MLQDRDRIFTNLYGFQSPFLDAARKRGDWDGTGQLLARVRPTSSAKSRHRSCAAEAAPDFRPASSGHSCRLSAPPASRPFSW